MTVVNGVVRPLKWKADVDERGECLNEPAVLGMLQEVFLTALVRWIPIENVEVGCIRHG